MAGDEAVTEACLWQWLALQPTKAEKYNQYHAPIEHR
jgi:hypothetical protein